MPHVLQITDKDVNGGGIRRAVELQAELLCARGWHVSRLRLGAGAGRDGDIPVPPPHPLRDRRQDWLPALQQHAARCDVIHLHLGFHRLSEGFVRAAAQCAPLVVNLHDIAPFVGARHATLRDRLVGHVMKRARAQVWAAITQVAAHIVSPSRYLSALAQEAGMPAARITRVPHPVQTGSMAPASPSDQPRLSVHAGLLSPEKGADVLIEAFASLPRTAGRLLVLGDGPSAADMAGAVAAHGLSDRVTFAGRVSPGEVRRAMAGARMVVHPSIIEEGLGLTGLEALAEGRPVAGFATGGAADWLVDDLTGLVAAAPTAAALAKVWQRLLEEEPLADRLGAGGQAHATAQFSPEAVGALLDSVLRDPLLVRMSE